MKPPECRWFVEELLRRTKTRSSCKRRPAVAFRYGDFGNSRIVGDNEALLAIHPILPETRSAVLGNTNRFPDAGDSASLRQIESHWFGRRAERGRRSFRKKAVRNRREHSPASEEV